MRPTPLEKASRTWLVSSRRTTLRAQAFLEYVDKAFAEVPNIIEYPTPVQVLIDFVYWPLLMFAMALASPEVEGRWQWRSLRPLALLSFVVRSAPLPPYIRCCPFGPCTVAVHGAAGHNRWGVAGTPLPVKTQGRNMGRSLTLNVYAVCRVACNPSGRNPSGLMGAVPRTGLPGRQTLLSASALGARAAGGEGGDPSTVSGPRGRGARWLTEHAAHPGRGDPRTDQKPTGQTVRVPHAGRPSPELAGNVPWTGRCSLRIKHRRYPRALGSRYLRSCWRLQPLL